MPSWGFNANVEGWVAGAWLDTDGVGGLGCLYADVVTEPTFARLSLAVAVAADDPYSAWVKVEAYEGNVTGGTVDVWIEAEAAGAGLVSSTVTTLTIPPADPQTYSSGWFRKALAFAGVDTVDNIYVKFHTLDEENSFNAFADAVYLAETDPLGSLNYTLTRSAGGVPGSVEI